MATSEKALSVVEVGSMAAARRAVPGLIRPIARPAELLETHEEVRALIADALMEGRDYGKIPGTGDKPTLLKPGAERVTMAFGCYSRFRVAEKEVDHDREVPWVKRKKKWENGRQTGEWEETRGSSIGLYRYVVECEIVHRESESVVGSCIAVCSSMEAKYVDRPRESENTVLKMAEKRAHVGAVLNAFGLSEQFTQDIEENPELYRRDGGGEQGGSGEEQPACPKCEGAMWDNRERNTEKEKKGEKLGPEWKCKDKKCGGLYWRGQWPPQTSATDDLAAGVRTMVEELSELDAQAGAEAEAYTEPILQKEGVTEADITAIGGRVKARLLRARQAKGQAQQEPPAQPQKSYIEEMEEANDREHAGPSPAPSANGGAWPDEDDDLPF